MINSNGISQIYLKDMDDDSIDLVSRDASLTPDNSIDGATKAKVSDDGLRIIFQSPDDNLSAINSFGITQIYLKNMSDESVQMISRTAAGDASNNTSGNPDMSNDGMHIVFESSAPNLPATNGVNNIYYVDSTAAIHAVEQISLSSSGAEANGVSNNPSISDDGLTVVFDSNATNLDDFDSDNTTDVFFRYRPLIFTRLVSANPNTNNSGNGASNNAKISGDANYVVFESLASDLVTETVTGTQDIFVRDLSTLPSTTIAKLNYPQAGGEATSDSNRPVISTDGRYVSFHSIEK
jgi:fructose-specific component phosphotransferase system IIB-like protein